MSKRRIAKDKLGGTVDFLYEMGMLARTPRSFYPFLGSGKQSVAEHINRTAYIGFSLAKIVGGVDVGKIVMMSLFHDIAETRVSDLNWVHQKYTDRNENKAMDDLERTIPYGESIRALWDEYHERKTEEAIIAKDADNLEFIISVMEEHWVGNKRAMSWIPSALKRLATPAAKSLGQEIVNTPADKWWFGDPKDEWWINRKKK